MKEKAEEGQQSTSSGGQTLNEKIEELSQTRHEDGEGDFADLGGLEKSEEGVVGGVQELRVRHEEGHRGGAQGL